MRNVHRTYHVNKERLRCSLDIAHEHGLRESDLKHDIPCIDCIASNEQSPQRKHCNPTINSFESKLLPGEGWRFDGGDCGQYSINGFRYVIVFVDVRSKKKVTYYCKSNRATEFKEALEYLIFHAKQFTGNDVKYLHSDMFSTYRQFVGEESIAAFRMQYGIQLRNPPPYAPPEW
mmetsp:Transcript_27650/g.85412  ORF Transcript_27650/g.85412 Transcript_27650/m.85412 type:complete len:175 (-) Transcript_27650:10024-10548(-)